MWESCQRCQTHFFKNILDRTPKKFQPELKVVLTNLYPAPELNEAAPWKYHLLEWNQEEAPMMVALLNTRFDKITAVTSLPEPSHKRLSTSNSIERLDDELRPRERVICLFSNETRMIRLMGSVPMEMHERWITRKNSFTMERCEADKEETRNAMHADCNKLNHVDQFTARPNPY
ncbi:MAG: transposase [Candidatus Cryosericum sp.]